MFLSSSALFAFIAKAFLLYLFITNTPWMVDPKEGGAGGGPNQFKWPKPFWSPNRGNNEMAPPNHQPEIMGGCVQNDVEQLSPMTNVEFKLTADEPCHSIIKASDHRVVNGQPAALGTRMFQVALFRRGKFACGGSFISRRFILTAAHCVDKYKPQELKIRYATRQYESGPVMNVHSIFSHPNFNISSVENDIALLRLAYPLPKIPLLIDRIELNHDTAVAMAANQSVVVSGWGRTGRSLPISKRLLMATLKTVDKEKCQEMWGEMFKVNQKTMICASDADKSACNGDSGGPLTLNDKLVGIVSVGSSTCLSAKRPNIYTNVAYYHQWIEDVVEKHS